MKTLVTTTLLALCAVLLPTAPATAGTGSPPATCDYQRYYPGRSNCEGYGWTISIKEECRRLGYPKRDRVCWALRPKPAHRYVTVRRGDTLWRIAVRAYGPGEYAGHQWKRIAKLNHIKGTTIYVGQRLRVY